MTTPTPLTWRQELAHISRMKRRLKHGEMTTDDPEWIEAHQNYAVGRIADYIEEMLATAPPLTPEQRDRLAELLKPAREAVAS